MSAGKRRRCYCGVYTDCHQRGEHRPHRAPALWLWFRDHSVWQHLAAPLWVRVPERWRWRIVDRLNRSQRRCWANLVDDALTHREDDACDTHVPELRPGKPRCADTCDWSHPSHAGEHACSCYCGKFQFTAPDGAIERKAATR